MLRTTLRRQNRRLQRLGFCVLLNACEVQVPACEKNRLWPVWRLVAFKLPVKEAPVETLKVAVGRGTGSSRKKAPKRGVGRLSQGGVSRETATHAPAARVLYVPPHPERAQCAASRTRGTEDYLLCARCTNARCLSLKEQEDARRKPTRGRRQR